MEMEVDGPGKRPPYGDQGMSTTAHRLTHLGQRCLLVAAGIAIWLPLGVASLFTILLGHEKSLSAGMAFANVWFMTAQAELIAIVLLLVYAGWARPWKSKGPTYDTFIVHSCAAGLIVLGGSTFFLSLIGGGR